MERRYKDQLNIFKHETHKLLPESDIDFRWDEREKVFYINVTTFYKGEFIKVSDCISTEVFIFPDKTKDAAEYCAHCFFEATQMAIDRKEKRRFVPYHRV